MANVFRVNVYQINQTVMQRDAPKNIGFPTQGFGTIQDVSGSPTRSLSSGYNVYGLITQNGVQYYVAETVAQLVTLIG